jgi:hypothetical protein
MFFNTEGSAIRTLISGYETSGGIEFTTLTLLLFLVTWYVFTITTYGVWVPAGLFLPGIIIGCSVGGLYANLHNLIFSNGNLDETLSDIDVTLVICAAGGMLAAYTRLSYSLVVIMLETTSSINIFIPMMLSILSARAIGGLLINGLYERAKRLKQMPVLIDNAPSATKRLDARQVMTTEVVTLPCIADMESIKKALQTSHNAFPVINTAGKLTGLMSRNFLVVILSKKAFYKGRPGLET